MSPRLDAHAHFFSPGYARRLPDDCRRIAPDEITLYTALAAHHDISQVLAVGFEGAQWASGNNAYLAQLAPDHPWVRPVAFVTHPDELTTAQLTQWQTQGFVGLSLYLLDDAISSTLSQVPAGGLAVACRSSLADQRQLARCALVGLATGSRPLPGTAAARLPPGSAADRSRRAGPRRRCRGAGRSDRARRLSRACMSNSAASMPWPSPAMPIRTRPPGPMWRSWRRLSRPTVCSGHPTSARHWKLSAFPKRST